MDDIAKNHHALLAWDRVMAGVREAMAQRSVQPARSVLLVPYVQLIPAARAAWVRGLSGKDAAVALLPRFETTMNWTSSLAGFDPAPEDIRMDAARDLLSASSLLRSSGLEQGHPVLAGHLMEAAWSVARLAAAVPPQQRVAWGARLSGALYGGGVAPALEVEARLGRVALAWAAHSAYRTDSLFVAEADLLVLLDGLQAEPLHDALAEVWGARVLRLRMDDSMGGPEGQVALHEARDMEDEAGRAAACVLAQVAQGRVPVALVAQDRVVVRRVRALLAHSGLPMRDETGWTLSTTRSAAGVVGLLRAAARDASSDSVLDWAKHSPALDAVLLARLEDRLRRDGVREWSRVGIDHPPVQAMRDVLETLQSARSLPAWLQALRAALQSSGQWQGMQDDPAGQAVLDALRLHAGAEQEFADATQRIGQGAFVAWVNQTLEADNFLPPYPELAQVVILPLTQLLGRTMGSVVLPGCDERHLQPSPEPPGIWTAAQRRLLGLPSREELAGSARAAWRYLLRTPHVDLIWRAADAGEPVLPSPFVQELLLQDPAPAPDPRGLRALESVPLGMPRPRGDDLPLTRLSASAYEDLRRCPYRFFALRQLGLQESDELDTDVGKLEFGNWLHLLLRHFHEALREAPTDNTDARLAMLDAAAERASAELRLADNEFLPFAASWPKVRVAYLRWLGDHEATGARFDEAESDRRVPLGDVTLVGRIDRIDRLADGRRLVIDYKTESARRTVERIKHPAEDTQLAFYAALLEDDTLDAQYLHIAESQPAKSYAQQQIVELRDQLLDGIRQDLGRIAAGAALPALGEGSACEFCAARGLCRKDFWTEHAAHAGAAHGT